MSAARAAKRAQLEALKAARAGGKRSWEAKEEVAIFDEVNEDDYRSIVKGRLAEDDFIEEDNGVSGYADNGEDHWDRSDESEDEEEREARKAAKKAKQKEKEEAAKKAASKRKARPAVVPAGANPYIKPKKDDAEVDDFMSSLIGGLDGQEAVAPKKPAFSTPKPAMPARLAKTAVSGFKRRADDDAASLRSISRNVSSSDVTASDPYSSDPPLGRDNAPSSDDGFGKKPRIDGLDAGTSGMDLDTNDDDLFDITTSLETKPKFEDDDEEDDMLVKPTVPAAKPKGPPVRRQLVNAAAVKVVKPEPVEIKVPVPELPVPQGDVKAKSKGMDWRTATAQLASLSGPAPDNADLAVDEQAEPLPLPESLVRAGSKKVEKVEKVNAFEEDGSVRFYWFDYIEPGGGKLVLVGKVKARGGKFDGKWVSATVLISGIKRKLYVLPRKESLDSEGNALVYEGEDGEEEQEPIEFDDVDMDFYTDATEKWGATGVESTPHWVRKKYAFGIKGIPREETNWLEVSCDFPSSSNPKTENGRDIPINASGERYSHVFGTNTSAFELFVIERKIMGPCWLNIKESQASKNEISWTRFEIEATKDHVSTFAQDDATAPSAPPPLTILSLSARTVVHLNENKREMVCASARVWTDANIDDQTPIEKQPSTVTTLVRNLFTPFPAKFRETAEAVYPRQSRNKIKCVADEKALLTELLDLIARSDPDIIVGHDFVALELDVLLTRLKDLKVDNWSRISRFRRPRWPKLNPTRNEGLLSGRLILDLSSDGSRGIIDSITWSLTEMCSTHLRIEREEIDPEDTPKFFDNVHSEAKHLLRFVQLCEVDTYFQMAIAFKVQALPLTRQLTNLAGNSWNKTLGGNRAERNEYILLHRFNENDYVVPDKIASWEKKAQVAAEAKAAKQKAKDNGEEVPKVAISKKKFTGGLVFEPTKGLWDRYILVMDFNSLYPSIIQEYDIDFSTIDWTVEGSDDIEKMPERAPCEGEPQGILPQLIASLVARRRNVKNLMKDRNLDKGKMAQYDITQKALKLTANSMYGCLGFEASRFYALPLASLTTFKGREILTRTKADAEALNLNVIYGDTDSIFINTNQTDYAAAIKIGESFKKTINDKYKKLEIDTDAVFERMLLLNKKKYAARKVESDGHVHVEIKGLDMKRREYCELSKNASQYVLDKILSGEQTEIVIEQIHEYLSGLGDNVRAGKIPLEQYIVVKRLGKNPQDYPDAKSLPHVQVAMRMKAKGQSAKSGDVIPYIFCLPANGESARSAKAENAYSPDEVRRAGSDLKVDFEVYLGAQILPPVERLCEPIEGTEKARLAQCLGLDAERYKSSTIDLPERNFRTLQSQISDEERYKNATALKIRCRACGAHTSFDGLVKNTANILSSSGFFCPNFDCLEPLSTASIGVQLDLQIRGYIAKFYEGWLKCDEPTCGNESRMMSVYGKRCLAAPCKGTVEFVYTDNDLYTQLLYFDTLFDPEKARNKVSGTASQDKISAIIDGNARTLADLRAVVKKHLDKNGRRWVSMTSLFSFMHNLQSLVSPVFQVSASSSSPNKEPARPLSPSTSPQKSRIGQILSDVSGSGTANGAASDADQPKAPIVRSVEAGDDQVWIGSSDGRVRVYEVGDGPLASWNAMSPSAQASGADGGRRTPTGDDNHAALDLVQEVYTTTRKAADRIALLPRLNKAVMLIEGVLSFHALPSLSPLSVHAFPALRGVTTFSLDEHELRNGGSPGIMHICAFKRRTVHLIKVTHDGASYVRELPLRGGALISVFRNSHACIADAENYSIIDLNEAVALPLLPISQMPNTDERPSSIASTSGGPSSVDPRQRPAVACVAENEFLIASHTGNTTLGVFVTETGEPCRGTLEWASNLRSLVVDALYSIALLHNNTVEIHSLHTQEIAQVIQLPTSSSPYSLQPRSLMHSSTGLDLSSASGANKLDSIPVPLLPSGSTSSAPSTPTRPRHRDSVSTSSMRDAMLQSKGKATLTTTFVVGKNSLHGLAPLTLVVQADALMEKGRVEDALALADQVEKASGSLQENPELGYVYLRAAYVSLASNLFQDAFNLFLRSQCDPRLVVRMFPDLRHPLISSRDETTVYQGVQAEVLDAKSVDDFIIANLNRNYSPHLQPDVESAPPTVELRAMLMTTARDSVLSYLKRWREARKTGGMHNSNDSRKVDIVVDTTLARLLAEKKQATELLELINGPNDCVLPSLEPALLEAGLYQLLASILLKRGEVSRTLDIWTKIVEGVYDDSSFTDGLQQIFDLLWTTKDKAVVEKYGIWLLQRERALGLKLFSDPKQTLAFDIRDLLAKMRAVDKDAADLYLEGAVLQERDTDSGLHADLIERYINRLSELLSDPATKAHLRQQETAYAELRASTSSPPSFLGFLTSQYYLSSEHAMFDSVRLKAILFLRASSRYDVTSVKKDLEDMEKRGLRGLTLERAIVYGKLQLDRQALSLILNTLHDFVSAETYCQQCGDPLTPADVASAATTLALPTAKRPLRRSSVKLESPQHQRKANLARLLVELCLADGESGNGAASPELVSSLLEAQATFVDTLEVLPSIPSAWPLKLLSPFLSGALRRSTHARHEAALLKAVSVSQNLAISEPLSELQMSLGPTIEREDLDKGEKRRRPEVVQVLRKEGKEEKGLPVDDVELVLR